MRPLAILLITLSLAAPAWADLVHLKNGSTISGEVVRANSQEVVIKTPSGRMTIPRRMVKSIEKQSRGRTYLSLARERFKAGAIKEAERLYKKAAKDPDKKIAQAAQRELRSLRARKARLHRLRRNPRTDFRLPRGLEGKPIEGETLQEQFDRARAAIDAGDGLRAIRLIRPLVLVNPKVKVLRYLLGRGLELSGKPKQARPEYVKVVGLRSVNRGRPAAWLGELARRKLTGEKLRSKSPGYGEDWKRVEVGPFALYHTEQKLAPRLRKLPEATLQTVVDGLGLKRRDMYFSGKVQVFLFEDAIELAAARWTWGDHAVLASAPDGPLQMIRTHPDEDHLKTTFRHEIAHAALFAAFPKMPLWAHEGAATSVEPPHVREGLMKIVRHQRKKGRLPELLAVLQGKAKPGKTGTEQQAFFGQATLIFEALVVLRGSIPKALKVCRIIGDKGLEKTLKAFKISLSDLKSAYELKLAE